MHRSLRDSQTSKNYQKYCWMKEHFFLKENTGKNYWLKVLGNSKKDNKMSRRTSLSIAEPSYDENIQITTESTRRQRIVQTIVDFVIIVIVFVIFAFVYGLVDPKTRHFYCNDTDIFFPYYPDTIPFWAIGIAGFFGPFLIILLTEIVTLFFNTN